MENKIIYLDDASTTKPSHLVLEKFCNIISNYFANPSSTYQTAIEIAKMQNQSRQKIANILKVKPEEVIFTSGASESNNMVLKGFLHVNRKKIITSSIEHPSVSQPLEQLNKIFNYQIVKIKVDQEGIIDYEQLENSLSKDTVLVSIIHVNNEVGCHFDVAKVRAIIDEFNYKNHCKIFYHIDISQSINKLVLDLSLVDFATFSFHKINGIKGSGVLIKKKGIQLTSLISGGEQEFGFRAGTENVFANIANAQTLLENQMIVNNYLKLEELNKYLRKSLEKIPNVLINSPINALPYILNISITDIPGQIVASALANFGIMISTTASCSLKKTKYSNTVFQMFNDLSRASSALRISLSTSTTREDLDFLVEKLKIVIEGIKK